MNQRASVTELFTDEDLRLMKRMSVRELVEKIAMETYGKAPLIPPHLSITVAQPHGIKPTPLQNLIDLFKTGEITLPPTHSQSPGMTFEKDLAQLQKAIEEGKYYKPLFPLFWWSKPFFYDLGE